MASFPFEKYSKKSEINSQMVFEKTLKNIPKKPCGS